MIFIIFFLLSLCSLPSFEGLAVASCTPPELAQAKQNKQKKKSTNTQRAFSIKPMPGTRVHTSPPIRITTAALMQHVSSQNGVSEIIKRAVEKPSSIIVNQFTAADYSETGQYGPSADAGVGSTQVILGSKGRIRSFNKSTGAIDTILNLAHDRFFSSVSQGNFTADPNIILDTTSTPNKWLLFCNVLDRILLAVSDGDPITTNTVWSFYVVDSTTPNPGFNAVLPYFDYTTLGVDEKAIYCAANIYDLTNENYLSSAAYVILKNSLTTTPAIYAFRNLINQTTYNGPFTLQGAQNFDTTSTKGYFISENYANVFANNSQELLLNTVTFVNSVPMLSAPQSIPVDPFVSPLYSPALGTPTPLFDPGVRLCPAHIRDDILRVVHEIGVDNTGTSTPSTTITRNGARFYAIDLTQSPPAVIEQGTVFQPSATNDINERFFIVPSIMSNKSGQVLIAATTCGTKEHLNMSITQIINGIPQTPVFVTASTTNYFATEDWEFNPFARWGDHTRTSIDPDNITFWPAGLWCSATNIWASQIAQVVLPS